MFSVWYQDLPRARHSAYQGGWASGHQEDRKANLPSPGCVHAPCRCQPCFDGAVWQVSVGYALPWTVSAGSTLGYLSWMLYLPCGFPVVDQAPARTQDKQGHPLSQHPGQTASSWLLPALPCSAVNIMVCSPSSPSLLLTGRNLQASIIGLFLPCSFGRRRPV